MLTNAIFALFYCSSPSSSLSWALQLLRREAISRVDPLILLSAVISGLAGGLVRAWVMGRRLLVPELNLAWLALVAYLPQSLAFQFSASRKLIPDGLAILILVVSQSLLLFFAWSNRRQPGFWLLGLGLGCNLAVILVNGGLMPISPETVVRLAPEATNTLWQVGERLGGGKDIVLEPSQMKLGWFSDRFFLPAWFPYSVAFSFGDILIAFGAFIFLWSLGRPGESETK
jgi:hypothetical protein